MTRRYRSVRGQTEFLCEPLIPEDFVIQSMPDASPTRWHLAHTTWFFETFLLKALRPDFRPYHADFEVLFNSYYNSIGEQFPRDRRGLLSRPSVSEIFAYRHAVDEQVLSLLDEQALEADQLKILETGLQHEQQHQELMLTDLKHLFSCNPLFPVYRDADRTVAAERGTPLEWIPVAGGLHQMGARSDVPFCFDNEQPRHKVFLEPYSLANRLVTNEEYLEFIEDGGYERPEHWLSLGWQAVQEERWRHPVYWHQTETGWSQFTLSGLQPIRPTEPVSHLSYFEADAFARWAGYRLPTEAEWEVAVESILADPHWEMEHGNFVGSEQYHPRPADSDAESTLQQAFGDLWEWTSSSYSPYPGYQIPEGAIGEYNGKFMCNQYVLRGGSCATPASHIRGSYRNFFPPGARWQFSGLRLAK